MPAVPGRTPGDGTRRHGGGTNPNRYFRPAVFLCDEYQSFASVGEDDPSGDEKACALTRTFSLLENCQAIVLPYDGTNARPASRVYLKPHYLPREHPYWRAREAGQI